jgi:hypothetical protein
LNGCGRFFGAGLDEHDPAACSPAIDRLQESIIELAHKRQTACRMTWA